MRSGVIMFALLALIGAGLSVPSVAVANAYYFPENKPGTPGVYASVTFAVSAYLTAGQNWQWKAVADQAGGDPVMHLSQHDTRHEVTDGYGDDNCILYSLSACITKTITTSDTYWILVYAKGPQSGGMGDKTFKLYYSLNNGPWYVYNNRSYPLGGYKVQPVAPPTTLSHNETFETVLVNDGPTATAIFRFDYNGNHWQPKDYDYLSGVGAASKLSGADPDRNSYFIITTASINPGPTRFVRNDAALIDSDYDGDGLGDNLERELCTCPDNGSMVCGVWCATVEPTDMDGDGLMDRYEVLGIDDPSHPQYLPRWGADPRHKDIFVEVDYYGVGTSKFGQADIDWVAQRFRVLENQENPDGEIGVNLHVDVGQDCEARDSTHDGITSICGNFGGSQALIADPLCLIGDNMNPIRKHVFHWAEACSENCGSGAWDRMCFPYRNPPVDFPHELGHNLGLDHCGIESAGKQNTKPNYPSLMNYAYARQLKDSSDVWFSDGSRSNWPLNPRGIGEGIYPLGIDTEFMCVPYGPYYFPCDPVTNRIDWNRDGTKEPELQVRANIGPAPQWVDGVTGCDQHWAHLANRETVQGVSPTVGPAAAVHWLNGPDGPVESTFAIVNEPAGLYPHQFKYARTDGVTGGWTAWTDLGTATHRQDSEPAAAAFTVNGIEYLFVFGATTSGTIRYNRIDQYGNPMQWNTPFPNQYGQVFKDVSAAVYTTDTGQQFLTLVATNLAGTSPGDVWYGLLDTNLAFSGWSRAQDAGNGNSQIRSPVVTPGLAAGPDHRIYMVTKVSEDASEELDPLRRGHLRLYYYSGTSGWRRANSTGDEDSPMWHDESDLPWKVLSRPAVAFRYHRDATGNHLPTERGALWVWYTVSATGAVTQGRFRNSWGPFSASEHDFGGALTMGRYQYPCDLGPQGSFAVADRSDSLTTLFIADGTVQHLPYGDAQGVPDTLYNDHDDSLTIAVSLCPSLNEGCIERCTDLTQPCSQQLGAGSPTRWLE